MLLQQGLNYKPLTISMAQEQNYSVNYTINVEATKGTREVQSFADAVGNLIKAKADLTPAVNNIQKMMNDIDRAFRTKSGRKRDYTYTLSIKTDSSEQKLERIHKLLTDINTLSKGINVSINAGQTLESDKMRRKVKEHRDKKLASDRADEIRQNADESVNSVLRAQRTITKVIGKINSAFTHLEKGREINIKTETAESRIKGLIALVTQLKNGSNITVNATTSHAVAPSYSGVANGVVAPFAPNHAYILPQKIADKLNEKLITGKALGIKS